MGVLVVLLGLAACTGDDEGESGSPATITFGTSASGIAGWNPHVAEHASPLLETIAANVYPSVFRVGPDLEPELDTDLMERAEVVGLREGQVVEYQIREDAEWSDGTPISGADFELLWQRLRVDRPAYANVRSLSVTDGGKLVRIGFTQPDGEWQRLFAHLLPAHLLTDEREWVAAFDGPEPPGVSGGPFRVAAHDPDLEVVLAPNGDYWGQRQAGVDQLVIRLDIGDRGDLGADLADGTVDVAAPEPGFDVVDQVRARDGMVVASTTGADSVQLVFDLGREPVSDVRVRRAVAHLVDRRELVARTIRFVDERIQPLGSHVLTPAHRRYQAHDRAFAETDPGAAAALLTEAGFVQSEAGTWHRPSPEPAGPEGGFAVPPLPLTLTLSIGIDGELGADIAELVAGPLEEAGIAVNVVDDDAPPDLVDMAVRPVASGELPGAEVAPSVARLLDEADHTLDPGAATALRQQADRLLWDALPALPLYPQPVVMAWRDGVTGPRPNPSPAGPLWNAWEWRPAA